MASRCCFLRAISQRESPSRRRRCHQQEYLVAVIPARKGATSCRERRLWRQPNAQPAQTRLPLLSASSAFGIRNEIGQRQNQQDGAHDHCGSITAGGARLRGVGVHSGVQHGERKACAQVERACVHARQVACIVFRGKPPRPRPFSMMFAVRCDGQMPSTTEITTSMAMLPRCARRNGAEQRAQNGHHETRAQHGVVAEFAGKNAGNGAEAQAEQRIRG